MSKLRVGLTTFICLLTSFPAFAEMGMDEKINLAVNHTLMRFPISFFRLSRLAVWTYPSFLSGCFWRPPFSRSISGSSICVPSSMDFNWCGVIIPTLAAGEVTHFQALATALSGTVGLGNIAGVAVAVSLGGPGATFWMILAGLLGMSSKFVECTLGVKYRNEYTDGTVSGGPMYYLSKGLAERSDKLKSWGKCWLCCSPFFVLVVPLAGATCSRPIRVSCNWSP